MSNTQPTRTVPGAGSIQVTTARGKGKKVVRKLSENGGLRESLRPFHKELFENTQSESFAAELESQEVITENQREECGSKSTNSQKNEYLYKIIYKKNAITPFIVALERSHNQHIIEFIDKKILTQSSTDGDGSGNEAGVEGSGSENDTHDANNDDSNAESIPMVPLKPVGDSERQADSNSCGSHTDDTVENGYISTIAGVSRNKRIPIIIILTLLLGSAILVSVLFYSIQNQAKNNNETDITVTTESGIQTSTPKLQMGVLRLTVDSPKPIKHNFEEVHLAIEPGGRYIKKYDWCTNWSIQNANSVTKLILKASLHDQDLRCILKSFPKLQHLEFSANYLCNEFLDIDDDSSHRITKAHPTDILILDNVKTLNISSMTPPCANIYKFVVKNVKFTQLEELTLKDITMAYENEKYIHEFFQAYGKDWKKMFLRNVTLLGNVEKPLFSELYFPNLVEAELLFKKGDAPIEVESLTNFNEATPNLEIFKSNVPCFVREWEDLRGKWEYVNVNLNEICIR